MGKAGRDVRGVEEDSGDNGGGSEDVEEDVGDGGKEGLHDGGDSDGAGGRGGVFVERQKERRANGNSNQSQWRLETPTI